MLRNESIILALDREENLHIFKYEKDVYAELVSIDVQNNEYECCNPMGTVR